MADLFVAVLTALFLALSWGLIRLADRFEGDA